MTDVVLRFEEYQQVRGAMAFARGTLDALGYEPPPGFPTLHEAGDTLQAAYARALDAEAEGS